MDNSIVRWLTVSDFWNFTRDLVTENPENPKQHSISGGHAIATWYVTPDVWELESGLTSLSFILVQDSNSKIISYGGDGWHDTNENNISDGVFENHGINSQLFSSMGVSELNNLYQNFTPPFKIHLFKEEENQTTPRVSVEKSMKEYTTARSYEVEISESDLEKIKSLNVV